MSDQISLNLNVLLRSLVQAVTVLGFMLQKNVKLSFVTLISIPSVVYLSKKFGSYYQVRLSPSQSAHCVLAYTYQHDCPPCLYLFFPTRAPLPSAASRERDAGRARQR
jgi:hypothetical protein